MNVSENKDDKRFYKLIDLVNATPKLQWNYNYLSSNRNLFLEDIIANISPTSNNSIFPFNKDRLSDNPLITLDFVKKYPNLTTEITKWNWRDLTFNKNISLSEKLENIDLPWYFYGLTSLIVETGNYDFILHHKYKHWDWSELTITAPLNLILSNSTLPWKREDIKYNKTITLLDVINHPEIKWDYDWLSSVIPLHDLMTQKIFNINYEYLSSNVTLTTRYLLEHKDEKWDISKLGDNTNLNFDILTKNNFFSDIDIHNNVLKVHGNKSITKSFIARYYDQFTFDDITTFFENKKLVFTDIFKYPVFKNSINAILGYSNFNLKYLNDTFPNYVMPTISWNAILQNDNISLKFLLEIAKLYNKQINYHLLSSNVNLTYDFIYAHLDKKWDMFELSVNNFNIEYTKRLIVDRLKTNYLNKKKKKLLDSYLIPDLNNIIIEY